ncbi:MAG: creatininase family protein [Planctomycetota bacterium]|jgi:creatinine amidohydrolase|nr:creatininase family protein [Planctomycetota bacterium]
MSTWKLQELNYQQVKSSDFEVALLPISAVEAHNLHLPYGTDHYQIEAIADRACEKAAEAGAKPVRLPGIPYGVESNLDKFPLSIHVQQSTLNLVVSDIVKALEKDGIRKLVVLNGHGGNDFKGCVRDLYAKSDVFIFVADWYRMAPDTLNEVFEDPGDHADEMETSCCLHLVPELVHLNQADEGVIRESRFKAMNQGLVWTTRPFDRLTTNCGVGNPHRATAEKGEKYLEAVVANLAEFLVELSASEIDELFPFKESSNS